MDNELTEQDIYTAFGIEQPAQADAQVVVQQADGAPAEDAADEASGEPEQSDGQAQTAKAEQSRDERRANAARRREKELKDAVDKAVAGERERAEARQKEAVDAVYRQLGYKDEADWQQQQQEQTRELRAKALKRLGLSESEGAALFPQAGEVAGMQAAAAEVETPDSGLTDDTAEEDEPFIGGAEELTRQLAEIAKLDPGIKSLEDLQAKPYAAEMAQALNARQFGTDEGRLVRAFKVFAQEDIIQARLADARKAGRQEALNRQAGKEHLALARERGGSGLPEVPRETLAAYKALMPGLSYDEYQQKYAAALKATS